MAPFRAPFPKLQNQAEGQTKSSPLQQTPMSNSNSNGMCNNQPHPMNPNQFPVQSNNPFFMNLPNNYQLPMQNLQMGMGFLPQGQFFPQNNFAQLQGNFQNNNPQNQFAWTQQQGQFFANNVPNMLAGQFNLQQQQQQYPLLPNQVTGLPHGQFPQQHMGFPQVNAFNVPPLMQNPMGLLNQGALGQGSQNPAFHMNQQPGMVNSHQVASNGQGQNMNIPSTMGQNALQGSQQLQRNGGQFQSNSQSGILGKPQGIPAKNTESNVSSMDQKSPQGNSFKKHLEESVNGEPRNMRFPKSNFHQMANANGNNRSFKGRGPNDKRARNPNLNKGTKLDTSMENRSSKPLALNYSEEEIQKWREERRKNHPSKSNTEKKSEDQTPPEVDSDAQRRRQQLKEILAKQAELGIEVAEIPKEYLVDSGNQVNETSKESENQVNGTAQNRNSNEKGRFNKRGRRRGGGNRFNKKQKAGKSDSSHKSVVIKKEPTLLQKLLSADIKRDKSHLLQAFRFMVLNNFFGDWPKKPLEFPLVTDKDTKSGSEIGKIASPNHTSGDISAIVEKDMVAPEEQDILEEDAAEDEDVEEDSEEGEIAD